MSFAAFARAGVAARAVRRLTALGAAAAMAVALTACGGGDQVNPFKPNKIVTFGDELSYIGTQDVAGDVLKGQRYGINAVTTVTRVFYRDGGVAQTTTQVTAKDMENTALAYAGEVYSVDSLGLTDTNAVEWLADTQLTLVKTETSGTTPAYTREFWAVWDCTNARQWMQILANAYGLGYNTACPADAAGAVSYAAIGANVDDVIQQIEAHRGELDNKTLVTIWAGQNDVIEQLAAYRATPGNLNAIKNELEARGVRLGQAVNRLLDTGARALIVSLPDLGKAPGAGSDGVALTEMTEAFNRGFIGVNGVKNDGTKIGLVKAFELIQDIERVPGDYGLNVGPAACDPALLKTPTGATSTSLLDCRQTTLIAGASLYSHLWASDFVLAPGGQARIGALAFERVNDNPF